jgi:hypothetical protein
MLGWLFSNTYINRLGRVRRLRRRQSFIEGNALWAMLRSGLGNEGLSKLAKRLPDTGSGRPCNAGS